MLNTKNDYDRAIYNGDMGLIVAITADGLDVCFDVGEEERTVRFTRADCIGLVHAYAISVHKSQGSEYPCVIIPLAREHTVMLHRPLIYTAMTRAKQLLVLVGSRRALQWAVGRQQAEQRYSGLTQRIAMAKG